MTSTATPTASTSIPSAAEASGRRSRRTLSRPISFVGIAVLFVALYVAAGAPSPLFVLEQGEWHFPAWMLTFAFAIYAVALLVSLLIAGSLSDHIGRRPVLIGALAIEIVSMAFFVVAPNIGWVIAARVVQGVATGAASGALTATMMELAPEHRKKLGAMIGSIAPLAGLGIGALVTGIAIELGTAPSGLIFGTLAIVFALGIVVVAVSRETVSRRPGALESLRPRVSVASTARAEFLGSIPLYIGTWMLGGFIFGLAPSAMRVVFHLDSGLLNGIVSALPTALGAGAVIAFGSASSRVTSIAGVTSIAIGATILALAIAQGPLALFLVGTAIAGAGFGAAFSGSIRQIAPMVEAHQRAELFAAVYTVSYLAFGIPAIAAGLLVGVIGLPATVLGYLAALVVAAVIGVVTQTRRLRAH